MLERPPKADGSGPLYNLVVMYHAYARWVKECIPGNLTRAEVSGSVECSSLAALLLSPLSPAPESLLVVCW